LASGLDLLKTLHASLPDVRVLVLSMHDETLYAERALAAGTRGYLMKHAAMEHVLDAIRSVASGRTYVSPQMSERIVTRVMERGGAADKAAPLERLTDRERQVFTLIGHGLETRAIATQLKVSVKTIETYHARIKEKLGLRGGHDLIRAAVSWAER
jgi:DNA-binding NarL/FixJ family response regulator